MKDDTHDAVDVADAVYVRVLRGYERFERAMNESFAADLLTLETNE